MTLLLGAADRGLGAAFLGNFRGEDALRTALGVPAGSSWLGARCCWARPSGPIRPRPRRRDAGRPSTSASTGAAGSRSGQGPAGDRRQDPWQPPPARWSGQPVPAGEACRHPPPRKAALSRTRLHHPAYPPPIHRRGTGRPRPIPPALGTLPSPDDRLRIVPWQDPVADPHGVPALFAIRGALLAGHHRSVDYLAPPSLSYGLELHRHGFELDLAETARSLGLGERMGKNSPFRRALVRLCTFELARAARPRWPGGTHPDSAPAAATPEPAARVAPASHRRWLDEQRLSGPEQMRRRAARLAAGLAASGLDRATAERRLAQWQFHPAVTYRAVEEAFGPEARLSPATS